MPSEGFFFPRGNLGSCLHWMPKLQTFQARYAELSANKKKWKRIIPALVISYHHVALSEVTAIKMR